MDHSTILKIIAERDKAVTRYQTLNEIKQKLHASASTWLKRSERLCQACDNSKPGSPNELKLFKSSQDALNRASVFIEIEKLLEPYTQKLTEELESVLTERQNAIDQLNEEIDSSKE